jgi:hypothetical protein
MKRLPRRKSPKLKDGKFFISYKKILFVENGVSTGNIPSH